MSTLRSYSQADHSFLAYIDEAGDEGFAFPARISDQGSSFWFFISAVVFTKGAGASQTEVLERTRSKIGKRAGTPLHFADLKHEQKIVYTGEIARGARCRIINVLVNKSEIMNRKKLAEKGALYHLASRLLVERISWLCRDRLKDTNRPVAGNGKVEIIFSKRRTFSPEAFQEYLHSLQSGDDSCSIEWRHIDVDSIQQVPHEELDGLQIADACVSSMRSAVELHPRTCGHSSVGELLKM